MPRPVKTGLGDGITADNKSAPTCAGTKSTGPESGTGADTGTRVLHFKEKETIKKTSWEQQKRQENKQRYLTDGPRGHHPLHLSRPLLEQRVFHLKEARNWITTNTKR
jgi:hypothetical protein